MVLQKWIKVMNLWCGSRGLFESKRLQILTNRYALPI